MNRLHDYMERIKPLVEAALDRLLPRPGLRAGVLYEAMRYCVLGGGKRLRPALCLASCHACGGTEAAALPAGCALELMHTYSLIHDDLPAMDNDDLRRGKLTCHKAFDEATAILAGDALQALAFETLAKSYPPAVAQESVLALARAVGPAGMVGGQILDLEGESAKPDLELLRAIHAGKTGALLGATCRLGGLAGGAQETVLNVLAEYGRHLGLLFHNVDDQLDVNGTAGQLGKTPGKDRLQKKLTYPRVLGVEESWQQARESAAAAKLAIKDLGKEALFLRLFADFLLERQN